MSRRTERVNDLLREEISDLLRSDLRDPRIGGLVSVTHVDVSPDLRRAYAYVSVLGTDEERAGTMRALEHAHLRGNQTGLRPLLSISDRRRNHCTSRYARKGL